MKTARQLKSCIENLQMYVRISLTVIQNFDHYQLYADYID